MYYEVTFNLEPTASMLVNAKDVFEAGKKVEEYFAEHGMGTWGIEIVEITKSSITRVIE